MNITIFPGIINKRFDEALRILKKPESDISKNIALDFFKTQLNLNALNPQQKVTANQYLALESQGAL